jgi:hypothetical protein
MALNKIIVVKETDNKISVGLPVTQETLDSVTDRGNVTNNSITVSGLTVNGAINVSGISASGITANSASILVIQNGTSYSGNQMVANQATIGQVNSTLTTTSGMVATNVTATTINASGITASGVTANSVSVANTLTSTVITATNDLNTNALNAVDIFSSTLEVEDITASSVTSTSVIANTVSAASGISVSGTSVFAGPVGIGINAPTAALHVTGSALIQGDIDTNGNLTIQKGNPRIRLRDTSGGGGSQGFDIHVDTTRFYIDDHLHNFNLLDYNFNVAASSNTLTLKSNRFIVATSPDGNFSPSSRVVVDGSGNVAIGLSGTTHRLHVSGNTRIDGIVSATTINATGLSSTSGTFTVVNASSTITSGITANSVAASSVTASSVSTNIIAPSSGSSIAIQAAIVAGSGGTFTVNDDGSVRMGSVADGAQLPNPLLEICNDTGASGNPSTIRLRNTDSDIAANDVIGRIDFFSNDSANVGVKARIQGVATDTTPDGYLTFHTQGGGGTSDPSERMRIDSSGNVGIGTSPSARLHVSGSVRIDGQATETPPANTTVVNRWLLINIDGTTLRLPLYL